MGIVDSIRSLFSKDDEGYAVTPSRYGLMFKSSKHDLCEQGKAPGKLQHQYIYLRNLCEAGQAQGGGGVNGGFLLPEETACALTEGERTLLDLPAPWPGSFDLLTKGHTFQTGGFHMRLDLRGPDGHVVRHWAMNGPYLQADGGTYMPDAAQRLALSAVLTHADLPAEKKTEGANLAAVYALQKACRAGVGIDLRAFDTIKVEEAGSVGVAVTETADGGLRLSPSFDIDGISPDMIERRLGQLGGSDAICMRIESNIVMLDERRIKAVQEILRNRRIAPADKESFLKAPGAFLDAYLVDLDDGLSMRVYGEEVFRKAYFGETDAQASDWFGLDELPVAVRLSEASKFVRTKEQFDDLSAKVREAVEEGRPSIPLDGVTILLPSDPGEVARDLDDIGRRVPDDRDGKADATGPHPGPPEERLTIGVHLNDETSFAGKADVEDDDAASGGYFWRGDLENSPMNFRPFPYQEDGIRWIVGHAMHAVAKDGRGKDGQSFEGALLADDMGLGKTFMTLAGIDAWHNIRRRSEGPSYVMKPTLIVAPVVLLETWRDEVAKFFPVSPFSSIVTLQRNGDMSRFRDPRVVHDRMERHALKVGREHGTSRLDMPGTLVLTNYDTLRVHPFSLASVDWGFVVFDEAQTIKNPNALSSRAAKGLKADFRLAVTGTPVENSLIDFWNIFDTVNTGVLDTCAAFRKTYVKPVIDGGHSEEIRRKVGTELRRRVGHLMLRRTKDENLADSLPRKHEYVGGKGDGESPRLAPVMSGLQLDVYDAVLKDVAVRSASGQCKDATLPALIRLRDVSMHPDLDAGRTLRIPSNEREAAEFIGQSSKLQVMLDVLKEIRDRGEKVIIFLFRRDLQRALAQALTILFKLDKVSVVSGETKSVSSRPDDGDTRKGLIRAFEERPGFGVIIMSPLAAGVGLTVVGANNVIHLERHWNPAKESQASDRVYRIGQSKDVNIYVPVLEHPERISFDRNLNQLLRRKIDLKEAVVTSGDVRPEDFDLNGIFGTGRA